MGYLLGICNIYGAIAWKPVNGKIIIFDIFDPK